MRTFRSINESTIKIRDINFVMNDDSVIVYMNHPNMGLVEWFSLDKDSKLFIRAIFVKNTAPEAIWLIEKLQETFDEVKRRKNSNLSISLIEKILSSKIFSKWWNKMKKEIVYKKFNL